MKSTYDLSGKTALITGASGALGEAFSLMLAQSGASVVLAGRREEPLRRVADRVAEGGGRAFPVVMDVRDEQSVRDAFARAEPHCGTIDVVICNAGIAVTRPALDLSAGDWDRVLGTNLGGCWHVAQEAARRLVAAKKGGSIVNVTSILGHRVAGAVMPYAVAKAGLEQMTRCLALEWARYGIRVNALAPGYIQTPLNDAFFQSDAGKAMVRRIPMRRLGHMDDLRAALLMLASDDSAYMTGSSVVIDGGHLQTSL